MHNEAMGLTKREYCTTIAMQGLLQVAAILGQKYTTNNGEMDYTLLAIESIKIADELGKQLSQPNNTQL